MNKSFTFIETIIIVGIMGLVLPALFAVVFVILQQQVKIVRLTQIKREGDFILNVLEDTLNNYATEVYSDQALTVKKCATTGSSYSSADGSNFYFKDRFGNWLRFQRKANGAVDSVASSSAAVSEIFLSSDKVTVSTMTMSCARSATYSTPVIDIRFSISYNTTSTRQEEKASLNYQTNIKLKSY